MKVHQHPRLTEPNVTKHLRDKHGWSPVKVYRLTYFQRLITHSSEHLPINTNGVAARKRAGSRGE